MYSELRNIESGSMLTSLALSATIERLDKFIRLREDLDNIQIGLESLIRGFFVESLNLK